jgi:hypothetical protein
MYIDPIDFDDNKYIFVSTWLSWDDAEKYCVKTGGHLASIHSLAESNFVYSMSNKAVLPRWLGASRASGAGLLDFSWADGSSFDYANWLLGEPTNSKGNENCISLSLKTDLANQLWNDANCNTMRPSVCKLSKTRKMHSVMHKF